VPKAGGDDTRHRRYHYHTRSGLHVLCSRRSDTDAQPYDGHRYADPGHNAENHADPAPVVGHNRAAQGLARMGGAALWVKLSNNIRRCPHWPLIPSRHLRRPVSQKPNLSRCSNMPCLSLRHRACPDVSGAARCKGTHVAGGSVSTPALKHHVLTTPWNAIRRGAVPQV
jgi:hypothetical protein